MKNDLGFNWFDKISVDDHNREGVVWRSGYWEVRRLLACLGCIDLGIIFGLYFYFDAEKEACFSASFFLFMSFLFISLMGSQTNIEIVYPHPFIKPYMYIQYISGLKGQGL